MNAEVEIFGDRVERLFAVIRERYLIRQRRDAGQPKPWTNDLILQRYRFVEAYRDMDAVTVWLRKNWYEPNTSNPDLWFSSVIGRFFNLPGSLQELGFPVPWDPTHCLLVMSDRNRRALKNYNAAYMIRSAPGGKTEYLVRDVFTPMWQSREQLRPRQGQSLSEYHFLLTSFHGLGSFLAAQIIADLKVYAPLSGAPDRETFAAPGPGSMKGLNWMVGRPDASPWKPEEWHATLLRLRNALAPLYQQSDMPVPCAQDTQNMLCDFASKYMRTLEGRGKPKQLYPGV